ncbi:MAG: DUF2809 domain-containing protein [bacterium]
MVSPFSENNPYFSCRVKTLIALSAITLLGFASKFYHGPAAWWFNDHLGGLLYEVFWILLINVVWPESSPFWVVLAVFLVTSALEFLQLWHPPFLQLVRSTFLGRTLIGTSFTWWDFPYYVLGCAAGYIWLRYVGRESGLTKST